MSTERITHWIDGQLWDGPAERSGDVYDPATGQITKTVDFASGADVDVAVASAKRAFDTEWGRATLTKRMQVLFRFRELMNQNKEQIAALITDEHGKEIGRAHV